MNSRMSTKNLLQVVVLALLALTVLVVPYLGNTYLIKIVINMCILIGLAASWNLVGGLAGQLSFGHAAFFGMGAYVLAIASDHQIPYPVAFLLGGAGAVVLSCVAYPTFRTSGTYFAIITIAFLESARLLAVNMEWVTHGNSGYIIMDSFRSNDLFPYYLIALIAALILFLTWLIIHSRFGLRLRALNQDQNAAQDLGVPVQRYKMLSLAISAFFCGVLGAYYAKYIGFIDPESVFSIRWSFDMIMMSIIGGLGTFFGPIIGAIVLTIMSEIFRLTFPSLSLLAYGALMMAMIVFWPSGIVGLFERLSSKFQNQKE